MGDISPDVFVNDWILVNEPPFICRVLDIKKNIHSRTNKVRDVTFTGKSVEIQASHNMGLFCQFYKIDDQGQLNVERKTVCLVNCDKYSGHLPDPSYPGPYYLLETVKKIQEHVAKLQ